MSPEKEALLESLLVERYACNHWWPTRRDEPVDDDLTVARRRRAMVADFEGLTSRKAGG